MSEFQVGDKVRVTAHAPGRPEAVPVGTILTVVDFVNHSDWINREVVELSWMTKPTTSYRFEKVVTSKTLAQVVAEVTALDAQEAAANTTLASIVEHREKLRVELASFGLTLIAGEHSVTPVVAPKTMRELYYADDIKRGDVFTFIGPRDHNRSWNVGVNYIVSRVDRDESVLMAELDDSEDQDWAWKNEGTFDKFVKAA